MQQLCNDSIWKGEQACNSWRSWFFTTLLGSGRLLRREYLDHMAILQYERHLRRSLPCHLEYYQRSLSTCGGWV